VEKMPLLGFGCLSILRSSLSEENACRVNAGDNLLCGWKASTTEWVLDHQEISHQMVFDSIAGRRTPGGDCQLAVDGAHMEIDGDDADDELLGDLRTRQALRK